MKEEYFKWYSPNLSMDIEMLKFGDRGYPVIIFPTTLGRYYECKDRHLVESVRWFVEQGLIQLFCPDSIDRYSWYNKNVHPSIRVRNHIFYDKMIRNEIVEKIRWDTPAGKVAVTGASFGGYQAANFAFRHPDIVSHLFTMSAKFDIKSLLDGFYSDDVYFNNPVDFLPNLQNEYLHQIKIILGTSEWDICKDANLEMSEILNRKGISHWLDLRAKRKHDWPTWHEMFPHYLSTI